MRTNMEKFGKILMAVMRAVFVLVNNLYCIPTYVIWCVIFHPLYYISPDLYWHYEGIFFDWLLTMVAFWSYSAGYRIVETGDIIDNLRDDETLVLVNHQSTSDVPLLMHCFCSRRKLLERLNWVMDAVFQYTNFGIVSTLHGDFFINAGRSKREASLKDLENYLRTKFIPRRRKWLVLFPEGGFLRKRKAASKRYAEKMKLPNLEYVTLPRLGAIQTIIDTLGSANASKDGTGDLDKKDGKLKYIVDMTIAYPNGEPLDLGTIITGHKPPCNIRMHYKIYPISEVPHQKPEELQSWLYNLYVEKNNVLGHYYLTGVWNQETRSIDINKTLKEGDATDGNFENANSTVTPGSDVVDEARRVPSHMEDDLIRRRISAATGLKFSDTELISDEKGEIKQCPEEEECIESSEEGKGEYYSKNIHLDLLRVGILHVLFMLSTATHCAMFYQIYSNIRNL